MRLCFIHAETLSGFFNRGKIIQKNTQQKRPFCNRCPPKVVVESRQHCASRPTHLLPRKMKFLHGDAKKSVVNREANGTSTYQYTSTTTTLKDRACLLMRLCTRSKGGSFMASQARFQSKGTGYVKRKRYFG